MDKEICVPCATYGCPKQFHVIQTIPNKPKLRGQRLSIQGPHNGVQKMTEPEEMTTKIRSTMNH
jgi:hypothetical protein